MAINENPALENRNTLYLAKSGGGKSQALKQNPEIPKRGARVLLWDPNNDHECDRVRTRSGLIKAVNKAMRSGRGFRIGYTPAEAGPEEFEWFANLVWLSLNGDRLLYVIVEEMADVSRHSGAARGIVKTLMNQGRKYGMRFHGTTQRSQEIYKTFYAQCEIQWIGGQKTTDAAAKMAKELDGVTAQDIKSLPPLAFYVDTPKGTERVQLKYKEAA